MCHTESKFLDAKRLVFPFSVPLCPECLTQCHNIREGLLTVWHLCPERQPLQVFSRTQGLLAIILVHSKVSTYFLFFFFNFCPGACWMLCSKLLFFFFKKKKEVCSLHLTKWHTGGQKKIRDFYTADEKEKRKLDGKCEPHAD